MPPDVLLSWSGISRTRGPHMTRESWGGLTTPDQTNEALLCDGRKCGPDMCRTPPSWSALELGSHLALKGHPGGSNSTAVAAH